MTTSRLSRRWDHPALNTSRPSRGRRSAALRCPLTVHIAGRRRTVAANHRGDMLEAAGDLVEAARSRPLQGHTDIGRFTWDLDQCVIDLLALKKGGRRGATKMLTEVKRVRTAVEELLQPHKMELVTLYNEAFLAEKRRRQDEALKAILFGDDDSEE